MTEDNKKTKAVETLERIKVPLDTILLDDIAGVGKILLRKLMTQVPEGVSDQVTVAVAGPTPVAMQPTDTDPPWFSARSLMMGRPGVCFFFNEPIRNPD